MGFYVETSDKRAWLAANAQPLSVSEVDYEAIRAKKMMIVCCIEVQFTDFVIGVIYSPREFRRFNDPRDLRRRDWFLVPEEVIKRDCKYAIDAEVEAKEIGIYA